MSCAIPLLPNFDMVSIRPARSMKWVKSVASCATDDHAERGVSEKMNSVSLPDLSPERFIKLNSVDPFEVSRAGGRAARYFSDSRSRERPWPENRR